MLPTTKDEFTEYCLRKLGAPVIDVNVDDDQVDDRIDEAIQFYQTYHYDSVEHMIITYEVTQEDMDNSYITMPNEIISVVKMVHDGAGLIMGGFGTNLWHSMSNISYDINFGSGACHYGTSYYTMMMGYMAELEFTFSVNRNIEFHLTNHKLYISGTLTEMNVGDLLAFDVYRIINPDDHAGIWQDRTLQNYAISLIGEQWGVNLSKFDNVELPGGLTLDGDKIYDRYHEERVNIEEKMQESFETPPMFIVG